MISPSDDRTPPLTPQLALRVAIIGGCALVMFAIIFFRLWFLQILSGNEYLAQARSNYTRPVEIQAPRGEILASNGQVLVNSEQVPAVLIQAPDLPVPVTDTASDLSDPPAADVQLYNQLARLLSISTKPRKCSYELWVGPKESLVHVRLSRVACSVAQGIGVSPFADVMVKSDVSADIQAYLLERQGHYPGVTLEQVPIRTYPYGALAAQVFGTVSPITGQELTQTKFKGVPETDDVGQSGLEYEYNQYLQGADGSETAKVNADGEFEGWGKVTQPTPGNNLLTSISLKLEQTGDSALAQSIATNGGAGGAFVAMDPENGQVYAMGSEPSYNPTDYQKDFEQLLNDNGDPLLNRAIQSAGADGSTFKVITATAAMESDVWGPDEYYDDTGQFCFPDTNPPDCLHNSGNAAYGDVDMESAIEVSDDVFFYHLGYLLNFKPINTYDHPDGGALQKWARAYGIGEKTGIDLPGEVAGTLPDPSVLSEFEQEEKQCEAATGPFKGRPLHPASQGGCGIAPIPSQYFGWTVGANVNTGVGQGDDQVTPMQLAVVYAALANGGTVVTPHIGETIESPTGTVIQKIDPAPKRHLDINSTYLQTILDGLHLAAQGGGTSSDVMGAFPKAVYGKTGTAQYINDGVETDYAWYACFVPASATSKPIVIVVTVEKGGFGDVAAAPVAREMLSQWFFGKPGSYTAGSSTDL